ncbi:MAG: hypothetical protein ABIP61_17155 [Burkholderiaceae bacterium]
MTAAIASSPVTAHAAAATSRAAFRAPTPQPSAPRFDMYAPIHKALRNCMSDTLRRVGRLDVSDAPDMAASLGQMHELLDLCLGHLQHENGFVHTAIEARRPGGAARTCADHVEHVESIEALRAEALALPTAAEPLRPGLALRLYQHLALFIAENYQHMHIEETANNTALWSLYSDVELLAIHARLMASIDPQEQLQVARWLIPAVTPLEAAEILNGARSQMPPEVFEVVLDTVRPHVDVNTWSQLCDTLGAAPRLGPPIPA